LRLDAALLRLGAFLADAFGAAFLAALFLEVALLFFAATFGRRVAGFALLVFLLAAVLAFAFGAAFLTAAFLRELALPVAVALGLSLVGIIESCVVGIEP
jgi:hypothetical protein